MYKNIIRNVIYVSFWIYINLNLNLIACSKVHLRYTHWNVLNNVYTSSLKQRIDWIYQEKQIKVIIKIFQSIVPPGNIRGNITKICPFNGTLLTLEYRYYEN